MSKPYQIIKRTKSERRERRAHGLFERRLNNGKRAQLDLCAARSQPPRPARSYPTRKEKRALPVMVDLGKIITVTIILGDLVEAP